VYTTGMSQELFTQATSDQVMNVPAGYNRNKDIDSCQLAQ